MRERTLGEMQNMIGGSQFRPLVELILTRERHWVRPSLYSFLAVPNAAERGAQQINWKLRSCFPFSQPSLDALAKSTTARNRLAGVTRRQKQYPYEMGNPTLSNVWKKGATSLEKIVPDPAFVLPPAFSRSDNGN